jgi:transporter family protein
MKAWILPAMGTFVFWGLWGFFPKLTTRYINPVSAMVYESIIGLPIGLIILATLNFKPEVHPRGIFYASLTGVLGILGALGYLTAVRRGDVTLVSSFTALSPALTILLATVLLGERLVLRQYLGIGLAFVAMMLIAA